MRNLEKRRIGSRSELEAHKTQLLGKPELDSSDHADLNMIDKALDADDVGQLTNVLDILGAREASRRALAAENPPDLGYEVAEGTDGETILAAKMAADQQALSNVLRHDPEETGRKVAELAYHFPAFRVHAVETVAELPAEGQRSLLADGIDPFAIRAYTDKTNAVWVVTHNTRPSEVSKVVGHEIIGHHGLRAVFQDGFGSFLDGVYRDHAAEILNLAPRYNVNPDDDASSIGGAGAVRQEARRLAL